MREEILSTVFRGDEAKAFCVVKPFHCSVCHDASYFPIGDISPLPISVAGCEPISINKIIGFRYKCSGTRFPGLRGWFPPVAGVSRPHLLLCCVGVGAFRVLMQRA